MSQYDYSHKDRSHSAFTHQPYHGLYNQGSTCYLNSVLQVLFMTKDFRDAVERYDCDAKCLDFHLKELFDALKCSTVSTYKLTDALGISRVFAQSDAAECFENILTRLTNPAASQLFQGMLTTKNRCSKCNNETSAENPFWSLPLEMEDCSDNYLVADGFYNYFKESHLHGSNQLYCESCSKKTDTTIRVEIKHHPEVLTLLLKRFKFDYSFRRHVKVRCTALIPEVLQMQPCGDMSQIYQLYAYVEHSGELKNGHYVVTIRAQDDDTWYLFNDNRVSLRYQQPFIGGNDKTNSEPYLLFYRKVCATAPCNADDAGASTAGSSESDQCSRNGEELREGEESKKATFRPECSENREKTHQNKGEMDHSVTAGTDDSILPPTDTPSELRKPLEINDYNSIGQGNKQEVSDSRENTPNSDNLHNKQHQDIDRKQDVSGKLSENHATHLSDEDVGVSKPETRKQYKHSKKESSGMAVSSNNPQEANKDSEKSAIKLPINCVEVDGKIYDFCQEITDYNNENYLLLKERHPARGEDVSKLSKCSDPECKIMQLFHHVHTSSSKDQNRKDSERKREVENMPTGQGSQETRPLNQPERGLTAPLCAANQNPVTSSTTNRALEKGEADAKYSHTSSHTSQTRNCSSLQGSGGSGAALQQSLGAEGHGSIDTIQSSFKRMKLDDSSDPNNAGGHAVPAETGSGSPPFPEPDYRKKAISQSDTRIQVETKEPEEGNSSAVCSGLFRTIYNSASK